MALGKRIPDLDPYGSYDLDKMRGDLYEVSKNEGSSAVPIYATGGSRKQRLDDIAEKVAMILPYLILTSPDGHRWKFTVDNTGMLSQPGEDLGI